MSQPIATVLLILWILLGIVGIAYLSRFRLRRWWKGNVANRDLAPHQRWPEILHWQQGDEFEWSMSGWYRLIALSEDGNAYVSEVTSNDKQIVGICSLVGRNVSLRNRRISQQLKNTAEYMELIKQFNIAYAELQERDKKLKLVS